MSDYRPVSNIRQPRIVYRIDDPEMAQVEKLRAYGTSRKLNLLYAEALRIGAEILLKQFEEGSTSIPIRTRLFVPELEKVSRAVSPTVAPVQAISPESDAPHPAVVIPPMPSEPRIKPSLLAPDRAQFQRYGD